MTPQPTAAAPGQVRTVPTEPPHRHDSPCYWDVDECRWQRLGYPLLSYALELSTATGRRVAPTSTETRP